MKLYTYDHCPYCVRARMIFGFKNIEFEHVILGNADEKTPIDMVGAKMLPILEKEDGSFMAESMDIIDYIDENYGEAIPFEQRNGHTPEGARIYVLDVEGINDPLDIAEGSLATWSWN